MTMAMAVRYGQPGLEKQIIITGKILHSAIVQVTEVDGFDPYCYQALSLPPTSGSQIGELVLGTRLGIT